MKSYSAVCGFEGKGHSLGLVELLRTDWVPMSTRVIIGIVGLCIAGSGVFLGNMLTMIMIGEINRKRQEGDLVSYFGFTPQKSRMIFHEYRRLYPNGKLHIYSYLAVAAVVSGMIIAAVCARIIG
jgi:hypothetical protein